MTAMQDLPRDACFVGPDGATYKVVVAASEHPNGFVEVWNLSMGDADVLDRVDDAYRAGHHPREGFFCYTHPVDVEVIS